MEGPEADGNPFVTAPFAEDFTESLPQGRVVGSRAPGGILRRGQDAERQISIDHGVMRFRPLVRPGWGREGVSYGPFRRQRGLTLAITMTNGHNASQGSAYFESFPKRVARWMVGPNADPPLLRAFEWLRGPRKKGTLRRLRWWSAISPRAYKLPFFNQNLAVGWHDAAAPDALDHAGSYFVMNSAEENNGDLWARVGGQFLSAVLNVKNVRLVLVVSIRDRGAVYYVGAVEGSIGFGHLPNLRPLAIDPLEDSETLYAGVHQCALGQIGWRSESLVHDLKVDVWEDAKTPFGTAHVSDSLTAAGGCVVAGQASGWSLPQGKTQLTDRGAMAATSHETLSVADPGTPSGLLHAILTPLSEDGSASLIWRMKDPFNYCVLTASCDGMTLSRVADGTWHTISEDRTTALSLHQPNSLQILDGFDQIGCFLDGTQLFGQFLDSADLADGTAVGLRFDGHAHSVAIRDFEAHPREVAPPFHLKTPTRPPRAGTKVVLADGYAGPAGDLAGRAPEVGAGTWERTKGRGRFTVRQEGGLQVSGSAAQPHPNRTLYTLPWAHSTFCDLAVTVTPPSSSGSEEQRTRAGIVFWQDPRNFLTISPWQNDTYPGSSISVFPKRHGFEELYDAVWTNVGTTIALARPFHLRCQFDGDSFFILLNGEPIMERALSDLYPDDPPLSINRVGLATNWEWGNDTGSVFGDFVARH